MVYIPPEIHEIIFSYIFDAKDQANYSGVSKTTRSVSKITILMQEQYSARLTQQFIESPIVSGMTHLNIHGNPFIQNIKHLKELSYLDCRGAMISDSGINGLGIRVMKFAGNKRVCKLYDLPELVYIDVPEYAVGDHDISGKYSLMTATTGACTVICCALSIIFLGLFLIVHLTQLGPQLYVNDHYVESMAVLQDTSIKLMKTCSNNCMDQYYLVSIKYAYRDLFGLLYDIIIDKHCYDTLQTCSVLASSVVAEFIVYIDPEQPHKYVREKILNTSYVANSIGLAAAVFVTFIFTTILLIACMISFRNIGMVYEKNREVYEKFTII